MERKNDKVILIPLDCIEPFPNHPFRITNDDAMRKLTDSIQNIGILNPIIVRRMDAGIWQLISGHRRKLACELLGWKTIPAVERDVDADTAAIMMVDSNFQRESLLPSEKARAYKMKLDAVKRQGARNDLISAHEGQKTNRKTSRELIAENSPDSSTQIQRYIRLNELIPELLDMVDAGRVAVTPAVELSYLTDEEQGAVVLTVESEQSSPSLSQAQRMRKTAEKQKLTADIILKIMSEKKKPESWNLTLPMNKVSRFFPSTYTCQQMQDTIIRLLENWLHMKKSQEENQGGRTK